MANRYWRGGTGTWNSATTHWSTTSGGSGGASVPTSSDDVFFDANSGGGTIDFAFASRSCNSLNLTGFTGTFGTGSDTTSLYVYGSLTYYSGMTLSYSGEMRFYATSTGKTVTTGGKTITHPMFFQGSGGGWTLQDTFTSSNATGIYLLDGTFDTGNNTMSVLAFNNSSIGTLVINLGSSTINLTGTGTGWGLSSSGTTLNAGTSTIKFTDTSSSAVSFAGADFTYSTLWFARGSSTGGITITGTNTFTEIKDTGTVAHTITFPNVTTTITTWTISGSSGNLITLARTGGSGTFTISKSTGTVSADYLSISNSTASGGATFYAGANSTDGGGNTGWIFTAPPAPFTASPMIHMMAQVGGL